MVSVSNDHGIDLKRKITELDWLSVPLLKGKFLVQIQMFSSLCPEALG
jgi:hypothetical protein